MYYLFGFCVHNHPMRKMVLLCLANDENNKHGLHIKNNRAEMLIEIFISHFSRRHHGTISSAWALWAEEQGERSTLMLTANQGDLSKLMMMMILISQGCVTWFK